MSKIATYRIGSDSKSDHIATSEQLETVISAACSKNSAKESTIYKYLCVEKIFFKNYFKVF